MFRLSFYNFLRSRITRISLLLVLACGLISILVGKQFLDNHAENIAATHTTQKAHLLRNAQYINSEMGLYLYYARFALVNQPDRLAGIAIGQKDVNPSIQSVTIRGLEAQKYDTDLTNPVNLLSGNLDLSFVIIYLFPLLIIAFCYNLLSEEKEGGTWRLVAAQSQRPWKLLLSKLAVRTAAVYGLLLLLLVLAVIILAVPLSKQLLALAAGAILYCAFWFALCLLVVSLHKSSNTSALALVGLWVLLAVLLPAGVNNLVANRYPVPEAFHTMIKQRDGYHEKFDMDKRATVEKFYAHYPELRKYPLPDKSFSWLWYYAMQQMGDDESAADARALYAKLQQRVKLSNQIASWVPTMQAQLQFSDLARSGLSDHLAFLDATTRFHENMRLYFYPKIFSEAAVASENWASFTPKYFTAPYDIPWSKHLFPVMVLTAALLLIAIRNTRSYAV